MYYAAFRFNASKLLGNCIHFLFNHYHEIADPDHEVLLHILDNATSNVNV